MARGVARWIKGTLSRETLCDALSSLEDMSDMSEAHKKVALSEL
jgi:hypothetical protein